MTRAGALSFTVFGFRQEDNAARWVGPRGEVALTFWGAFTAMLPASLLDGGILCLPCFVCNGTKVAGFNSLPLVWRGEFMLLSRLGGSG